jgi:hypothetical protein
VNETYICFRRREIKAVRKKRVSQATPSDNLVCLQAELTYPLELAKAVLVRDTMNMGYAQQAQLVWEKRLALVDLKRTFPKAMRNYWLTKKNLRSQGAHASSLILNVFQSIDIPIIVAQSSRRRISKALPPRNCGTTQRAHCSSPRPHRGHNSPAREMPAIKGKVKWRQAVSHFDNVSTLNTYFS